MRRFLNFEVTDDRLCKSTLIRPIRRLLPGRTAPASTIGAAPLGSERGRAAWKTKPEALWLGGSLHAKESVDHG